VLKLTIAARRRANACAILAGVLIALLLATADGKSATWAIQTTPNATGAEHSELQHIACDPLNEGICTAVGKQTTAGVNTPYAQYWGGASWTNQSVAVPAGATASELQSNSCYGSVACTAVGSYTTRSGTFSLAESWTGFSWTIQATPNPAGATETQFQDVSCAASFGGSECLAVGSSVVGGVRSAMGQRWSSREWALQTVPQPGTATASELNGIACSGGLSVTCVAVGDYTVSGGAYWAMAMTWNGTAWTLQTVPNPAGATRSILLDVSCSNARTCTAVGGYRDSRGVQQTFVSRWDGTSWTTQTSPNPAGSTNSVLQNVSCLDHDACVAVGDWVNAGSWQPMAMYWNRASSWALDTTPNPSGATFALLDGVECRMTCKGIGWYTEGGRNRTLGMKRGAPSWTQQTMPSPALSSFVDGLSCVTAASCIAVGRQVAEGMTSGTAQTFSWNGSAWSSAGQPAPVGAVTSDLRNVSCTSSSACTAVGYYTNSARVEIPYAARYTGSWSVQTVPLPAGIAAGRLAGVSCTTSTACTAVGRYVNGSGVYQTFAATWNGTSWSVQTTPTAPSAAQELFSVSCTASEACTAVGTSAWSNPLVLRWNGSSWSSQTSPLPPGATEATLSDVTCTGASACIAGGRASGYTHAIAWDGTSWSVITSPRLAFGSSSFDDISCTAARACVAVGTYRGNGMDQRLAASWDGTGWTLHEIANPASSSYLSGVVCFTSTTCQAVGTGPGGIAASYP